MMLKFLLAALAVAETSFAAPGLTARAEDVSAYENNPFADIQLFPDPYYVDEIEKLAIPKLSGELAAKAREVTKISTFQWL